MVYSVSFVMGAWHFLQAYIFGADSDGGLNAGISNSDIFGKKGSSLGIHISEKIYTCEGYQYQNIYNQISKKRTWWLKIS